MNLPIEPMTGPEFERFYACDEMPERFWPEEIEKKRNEYAVGAITLVDFEGYLDALMSVRDTEQEHDA
jgi:hypothetical protein